MRLARLAFVSITLLAFAPPAFAENASLPLVAKLLAGLSDGGTMMQGTLGKGAVKATGEGGWEVTFAKDSIKFLYDEPDTCRFTQHLQMNGDSNEARLDFSKVNSVDVRDQGEVEGLHGALITFDGPPEMLQVQVGDKLMNQQPAFAFLVSDITVEEFRAAADELLRIC